METFTAQIQHFGLVLGRLTPLFLASNLSPFARFPNMVRMVVLVTISVTFFSLLEPRPPFQQNTEWGINFINELVLGLIMLVGIQVTYAAIMMVGRVLDMQIGFAAAGIVDPNNNNNDPLLGYIFALFISLAIFLTNSHLQILEAIKISFDLIPPGQWNGRINIATLTGFFTSQTILAFLVLSPVMMGLWLMDMFNGLISKSMPQMNVYFVMLPLKIFAGLALFTATFPYVKPHIARLFAEVVAWYQGGFVN